MTWLTPAEGIKLMAHGIRTMGIIGDFPMNEEDRKSYDAHYAEEDIRKAQDPTYKGKAWFRDGVGPQPTQEEITAESTKFIAELIVKRPKDFNYMSEVVSFDLVDNFKKELAEIVADEEKHK